MLPDYLREQNTSFVYRYKRPFIFALVGLVLFIVIGGIYAYKAGLLIKPLSQPEDRQEFLTIDPFTKPLILSLDSPLKDKNGIPYSGFVEYDPVTEIYSYIASEDEGTITPLGITSFLGDSHYLAVRTTGTSTDLVVYDRSKYATARIVKNIPSGFLVPSVAWAVTNNKFAYQIVGSKTAAINVEEKEGLGEVRTLDFSFPLIGFSSDGSKILTRGTSALSMVNVSDGSHRMTTGVAFLDPKARLMLSPDGNSLVTVSETQVDWYAVDWENAVLQLVAEKVSPTKISDAVFNRDSSLLVREEGTKLVRLYGFSGGSLIENFATLSLPDNVHILHVVE